MALKAKLANLEGLDDGTKAHYRQSSDGTYHLDVEGDDQREALLRAKEHEKSARQRAEDEAKKYAADLAELRAAHEESLRKNVPLDNVKALEASWGKKLADAETAAKARIGSLESGMRKVLISEKAAAMAASLAADQEYVPLIQQQIESRLAVEIGDDGVASARVLKDGKPSALTLEELSQEIAGMKMLRAVVSGSKASGGGANGGTGGSGATPKKPNFATASPKEIAAYYAAVDAGKG